MEGKREGKEESLQAKAALIAEECIAVRLRLLTRAVTKIYTQALHLEKSTLSRDLARMRVQGWVTESAGDEARATILSVTSAGKRLLEKAFPAWRQAQEEAKVLLGEKEADSLGRSVRAVRMRGAVARV